MLKSMRTFTAEHLFRLNLMATARSEESTLASRKDLDELVGVQTEWWAKRGPLRSFEKTDALSALNRESVSVYILSIRSGRIDVWRKAPPAPRASEHDVLRQSLFRLRVRLYKTYLEHVLRRSSNRASFDIALDVDDITRDDAEVPILAFQKHETARNILLPDVDFFGYDWYRHDDDPYTYDEKNIAACFVGASTGGMVSVDTVRRSSTPRLRAARYFCGNPSILFRISAAAQCTSPDAAALLRAQPYFGAHVPWRDQLRSRFLISMDGNGAACSRLARGFRSDSAVIKFNSPHCLFYFPALAAGREYLSVASEAEIEPIIERERATPGSYRAVARAGRAFAERFLTAASTFSYTARLMKQIAAMQ